MIVDAPAILCVSITRRRTNSLINDTRKQTARPLAEHKSRNAWHRGVYGGARRRRLQRPDNRCGRGWSNPVARCASDPAREPRRRSRTENDGAARNVRARLHARRNAYPPQQGRVCDRAVRDVSGRQRSRQLPQPRVLLAAGIEQVRKWGLPRSLLRMAFLSSKTGQFTYFSQQLGAPNWRGTNVLDFGGNIGNMLRDPNCTIDEERYWCIDVVRESIERGRKVFPKAHWIFYDRYSFFFNPRGAKHLELPEMDTLFDYVVAYSVFTNTSRSDMLDLVSQLESKLTRDGTLAFTFIDPNYYSWPGR